MSEIHRDHLSASVEDLLDIAGVIDAVCESLTLYVYGQEIDEVPFRRALFALLDRPTQALWEVARDEWVAPNFLPAPPCLGQAAEQPGMTFADACYAYGLPDAVCPSRRSLRAILRWALDQAHGRE